LVKLEIKEYFIFVKHIPGGSVSLAMVGERE
jgi:hypothetical protein